MNTSTQIQDSVFNAQGRFGRLSYLGWNMLIGIAFFFIGVVSAFLIPTMTDTSTGFLTYILVGLFIIIYIVALYVSFIFTIRRLHDRNQTGWLSLLMLIPLVNFLFFIYLSCAKGDVGINNYGSPRMTRGWEKVLAWIYIIFIPIIILALAATAIPAYKEYVQRSQQAQIEQQINQAK